MALFVRLRLLKETLCRALSFCKEFSVSNSIPAAYVSEVYERYKAVPTWPIGDKVVLGDVGVVSKNGQFKKITSLKELGISFKVDTGTGISNANLRTSGAVTLKMLSQVKGLSTIEISFSQKNAVLFDQKGVRNSKIRMLDSLARSILTKVEEKIWMPEYLVVSRLYTATEVTLLVSDSKNSKISLVGKLPVSGKIPVPLTGQFVVHEEASMSHHQMASGPKLITMFELAKLNSPIARIFTRGEPRLNQPKRVVSPPRKSASAKPAKPTLANNSIKVGGSVQKCKLVLASKKDLGL